MARDFETIVKIRLLDSGAQAPRKMTRGAAGFDIFAFLDEPVILKPGERTIVPSGFSMELEEGFEAMIRPRSGLAAREGITLLNTPGTIDADYRGEVRLILINLGDRPFKIESGMRLAQMVINRIPSAVVEITEELTETERSDGGFGSTGQ